VERKKREKNKAVQKREPIMKNILLKVGSGIILLIISCIGLIISIIAMPILMIIWFVAMLFFKHWVTSSFTLLPTLNDRMELQFLNYEIHLKKD